MVALGREAEALAGPNTQVIDLGGRTVIPGLIDSHVRQHAWGMNLPAVQLLGARSLADVLAAIGERARATPQTPMLRTGGIKFLLDGGGEGGRMTEPYRIVAGEQTNAEYRGILLLPPGGEAELLDGLRLIHRAGLQIQTHAVGDHTIDLITRLYEQVNGELGPVRPLRWTVMHIFLPTPEALQRMERLGVIATAQNHPVLLGHNQRRWWGDERAAYSIPIRAMLDAGVHVGGGTDAPVVPGDPFQSMWWMTTRGTLPGYRLGPEWAITAREALRLYTRNNAVLLGSEAELGSIEPGKFADLVVLSQDILAVEAERIRETRTMMTLLGGRVVHRQGM